MSVPAFCPMDGMSRGPGLAVDVGGTGRLIWWCQVLGGPADDGTEDAKSWRGSGR